MVTELFVSADEVWYSTPDGMRPMREGDEIVNELVERIKDMYPRAYEALTKIYVRSSANPTYYNFLIARRFAKCNFGALDHTKMDIDMTYNLERVPCPLQGECPYERIICQPQMETRLSAAEERVMRLVVQGRCNAEIAEELFLSPNTVKRHIAHAFAKTGVSSRAEFCHYANKNNLFINP